MDLLHFYPLRVSLDRKPGRAVHAKVRAREKYKKEEKKRKRKRKEARKVETPQSAPWQKSEPNIVKVKIPEWTLTGTT